MGGVAKPRCARGQNCSHIRDFPHIDKPPKVPREGALCGRCRRAGHDGTALAEPGYQELLRAARTLLDNDVRDEDEIIPTLVFAGNLDGNPRLKSIWGGLTKAHRGSEAWAELQNQVYTLFGGLVLPSRIVDGVPVVRRAPFRISVARDKDEHIEVIAFDVFKRSATGREVVSGTSGIWTKRILTMTSTASAEAPTL